MSLKQLDVRRIVADLVKGRNAGYLAAGALVIAAGAYGAVSIVPQTDGLGDADSAQVADAVQSDVDAAGKLAGGPPAAPRAVLDASGRVSRPAAVRGIYLNAWAAGSTRKLDKLIDIANRTEINAFVIDVKEGGEISYVSNVPLAREIGSYRKYIPNIQGTLAKLKAAGIYPIARIVVFRDPVLAEARPDYAVQNADGSGVWADNKGHKWVDSFNRDVWDYNIAIAREAIELGFSEIQWDYVRFPDVPRSYMSTANWPARNGREKEDGIREFMLYSRAQLADLDVPITADVFGLTVSARDDMGIGQLWEKMVDASDVLLPMIYPSHFAGGSYGISHPNAAPYEVVKTALEHARRRTEGTANPARVVPWLQDFTLGPPRYGPYYVRAQIQAVYDAGYDEWVLWHPGSNYTVEALADADGKAPSFEKPRVDSVPARPKTAPVDSTRLRDENGVLGKPIGN